jgi:hypothetical protein
MRIIAAGVSQAISEILKPHLARIAELESEVALLRAVGSKKDKRK